MERGSSAAPPCSALAWQETKKAEVRRRERALRERNAAKTLAFEEACARRRRARTKEAEANELHLARGRPTIGRLRGAPASDDGLGARLRHAALRATPDEALAEHEKEKKKTFSFSNDENEPGETYRAETYRGDVSREKVSFTLGRPDGLVVPKLADPDDDVSVHAIKNEPDSDAVPERGSDPRSSTSTAAAESNKPFASEFAPIRSPALERPQSVPKIYLCSRTLLAAAPAHAGAEAHALRPRYAVLAGSRKQYCPIGKNDEECTELTKNKNRGETACGWYNKKDAVVEELHRARVWDMEDLDTVAKSHLGCQYYAMRALHKNAELVLCPYNYVFDENIRKALEIDLTGAAVIIDEGHNVEDVCRDGASMEISVTELEDTASQLGSVAKFPDDADVAARLMRPLKDWVNRSLAESSSHASSHASKSSFKRQRFRRAGRGGPRRGAVEGR